MHLTNKIFSLAVLSICLLAPWNAFSQNDPKADPAAVICEGNARFTVLTDRLIRMEWSSDGKFEDRATFAIVNRNLPVPEFKVSRKDGLVLKTSAVELRYKGGRFDQDNLSVTFLMNGKKVCWHPGMSQDGNLMGTTRTLDGCRGFEKINKTLDAMETGVLSRDGWAIVDESSRDVFEEDSSDWGAWLGEKRTQDRFDLYIFAYGHDYAAALGDFTKVAGRIPMPPKYTFGYWWSRWWAYTDQEVLDLADEIRSRGIPADVFIIDMDWHETWMPMQDRYGKDEFGQERGWTGYTWNRNLFPNPVGTLHDLHSRGFKTSLDLHLASGIQPYEECYDRFVADYLSRTDEYDGPEGYVYGPEGYLYAGQERPELSGKEGYPAPVPFRMSQKAWADAYFNSVIHPLERMGVDFWWLDWQQWKLSKYVDGLSNTFWLNHTFFNDMVRQNAYLGKDAPRPFIYHRWGGLGSHRYQLGFSGDTMEDWAVLAYLPYFTATASNVGYGYWGHDIGGHMQIVKRRTDPELFTRWIQYGVFTPIFKTHSTKSKFTDRRIWAYESHYEYMKDAIVLRYALTPYIYDMARVTYESGVSLCRPMYYNYPEDERSYSCKEQFFFGDRIIATALCQPLDPSTGKTARSMWFPKGCDWYDMAHHCTLKGGTQTTLYYGIDENPWYVKAGSVLPLARKGILTLQENSDEWRILVVPGKSASSYTHWEDDGISQAYDTDYATTRIDKRCYGKTTTIVVSAREGGYKGMLSTRTLGIVMEGVTAVSQVKVNGTALPSGNITAFENSVEISLPQMSAAQETRIEITR